MIVSFRDRRTQRFAEGQRVKEFSGFARQAEVRLDRLEAAICFEWPEGSAGPANVEIVDYH